MKTTTKKGKKPAPKKEVRKAAAKQNDSAWNLVLYIAGNTAKSAAAIRNLKSICEQHLDSKYNIVIVDLSKDPKLAKEDQILAIPTLVKKLPAPVRKIIGDLSNTDKVLVGLNLRSVTS